MARAFYEVLSRLFREELKQHSAFNFFSIIPERMLFMTSSMPKDADKENNTNQSRYRGKEIGIHSGSHKLCSSGEWKKGLLINCSKAANGMVFGKDFLNYSAVLFSYCLKTLVQGRLKQFLGSMSFAPFVVELLLGQRKFLTCGGGGRLWQYLSLKVLLCPLVISDDNM